jgi:hypothetical protein
MTVPREKSVPILCPVCWGARTILIHIALLIVIVRLWRVQRRKLLPFLIEQLVECNAGLVHGGADRVEQEAVFYHELKVGVELFSIGVDTAAHLVLHGGQVHGLLDDFGIMRNVKGDDICGVDMTSVTPSMKYSTHRLEHRMDRQ